MGSARTMRVLVVDDDQDILDLLQYNLEREGFTVKALSQSHKALRVALEFCPDLVVLDLMMPHPNGIELCREFRNSALLKNAYIFFLTARSEDYYQHAALQTGADDYLEKITGIRALTNKIISVLKKRYIIRKRENDVEVGSIRLSRRNKAVLNPAGQLVELNASEFELLFFFAQNPGRVISGANLVQIVYGSDTFFADKSIDSVIQALTRKLGAHLIKTVDRDHYRFSSTV